MVAERYCPDCGLALPSKAELMGCPHCLFRMAAGEDPKAGTTDGQPAIPHGLRSRFFGDYEILAELARGGMGVIYRARQISLNRVVALKMLQPGHLPSPEAWLRFQTEIAASAQLNHPNIVALHESAIVDGVHFFTMRLLEGGNLATRLAGARTATQSSATSATTRTTRDTQVTTVRLMLKVARAVHYAHQRGVLHRDLKPSNILLDERGEPQVADFGLAKMLANESAATLTDSILGSPNYMAPEQANGRGRNFTVETDVYGLGAILYEALTGVPPFQARTPVETIRKVLDEEPVALRKLNPGIDGDLETICLKCLQKLSSARYPSAEEFAADLERWLQGLPILARPVGPFGSVVRWGRRHPGLATVSALLILMLVVVAVGASVAAVRIRHAEQAALVRLRESLLDQVRVLRTSQVAGGRTEARQLLRQAAALGGPPEFRERIRDELLGILSLPQVEFTPLPNVKVEGAMQVLLDPAMKRLARIVNMTNVTVDDVGGSAPSRKIGSTGDGGQLEGFSPDGRCLAVRHARGLDFYDIEAGRLSFSTEERARVFCFATHAPLVALEEDNSEISLRELPTGQEVRRLKLRPDMPGARGRGFVALSLSPDGTLLACGRVVDNAIELVEMETGRVRWRVTQDATPSAFAWQSTRGGRLIASTSDGRLVILRLADGNVVVGLGSATAAHSLALDDASELLAVAYHNRRVRIWDLASLRLLFETECEGRNLAFGNNATRLGTVIRGDRIGWISFEPSPEFKEKVVAATSRNVEECVFTGKGDMIAFGYPRRIVLINSTGRGARGGVDIGAIPVLAMDPRGEFMLTSDGSGVTLRPLPDSPSAMLSAENTRLVIPGSRWRSLAFSDDGNRVWVSNAYSNMVYGYTRDFSAVETALGPHEFPDAVAASPDGRWVASGSSLLLNAKVWNVETRAEALTLHAGRKHRLSFSGDGRWLAVHGDVFELRRIGTWENAPPLPYPGARPALGAAAFSPDGKILAVVEDQEQIHLFDLSGWKSLGLLRSPIAGSINALAFSPDGAQLAAACVRGRMRVWNLRALNQELAALNLDWKVASTGPP